MHVVRSLLDALRIIGDEVIFLENIMHTHTNITDPKILSKTYKAIQRLIKKNRIEAFFSFRPSDLSPEHLNYLREENIITFTWFSDDPLLYKTAYEKIVELYDVVLTSGYTDVLNFYENRHNTFPITFPFWTNNVYFPNQYNPEVADIDVGFLGNCHGKNRASRYSFLSSLPFGIKIFGKLKQKDEAGIWAGEISNFKKIPKILQRFRLGLNIPQYFSDAKETKYWFEDLSLFESFYIPSRIVQYAASGIPILTPKTRHIETVSKNLIVYNSREELISMVRDLLYRSDNLYELSMNTHNEFINIFHAENRAQLLHYLVNYIRSGKDIASISQSERLNLWKSFPPRDNYD